MLSEEPDPRSMAIHEAGHAVAAHRLGETVVAMVLEETHGATAIRQPPADAQRAYIERVAAVYLAGPIALAMYRGIPALPFAPTGEMLDDMTRATELLGRIPDITEAEITEVLKDLGDRVGKLLSDRETWAQVGRLADELLTKRRLTDEDVAAIAPLSQ